MRQKLFYFIFKLYSGGLFLTSTIQGNYLVLAATQSVQCSHFLNSNNFYQERLKLIRILAPFKRSHLRIPPFFTLSLTLLRILLVSVLGSIFVVLEIQDRNRTI